MFGFKMAAKIDISLCEKKSRDQNLKKKHTFAKDVFSEIWLKLGNCDYNYIYKILLQVDFSGKSVFSHPKMLIYANDRKTTRPISFFLRSEAQ